jgi:hypothetical protein
MFNDRFIFDNQELADYIDNTPNPVDSELENLSNRLATYAREVRRYSALLEQKSTWEIYQTATIHSDPHIALVLAAADDEEGNPMFPSEEAIKNILYGLDSVEGSENEDFLSDGVRRVSIALTASILTGQLSQIPEQFQHSNSIKKQALEDLERIISIPESVKKKEVEEPSQEFNSTFFFSRQEVDIREGDQLTCSIYIPSLTNSGLGWQTVATYEESVSTAAIVSDIADTINELTLEDNTANLVASPVLSGPAGTHTIDFYVRYNFQGIQSEVISIRFDFFDEFEGRTIEQVPFRWGIKSSQLTYYYLNSTVIILTGDTTGSKVSQLDSQEDSAQNSIYFRSKDVVCSSNKIKFRINPTDEQVRTVYIPDDLDPEDRPGAAALAMINELSSIQGETRSLGAIIRNDGSDLDNPVAAFKLIAFSTTNPEQYIVLDILSVPEDLEVALGDTKRPLTRFSSKPKSLRIKTTYDNNFPLNSEELKSANRSVGVVKFPRSKVLDDIKDETRLMEQPVHPFDFK